MTYGWRGSLLLIGGITLNACVCGALMRPNRIRSTQNFEQQQDVQKIETTESFLKLFKSPRYIILCSSNFLFSFGYSVFSTHMPAFSVRDLGLNEYEMSTLVSVTGISNLFFRLLQGAILDVRCVDTQVVYVACYSGMGVVIGCLPFVVSFPGMVVTCVLFGATFAGFGPALSAMTVLYCGDRLFVSGNGFLYLTCGIAIMLGAPVAGNNESIVRNRTSVRRANLYSICIRVAKLYSLIFIC